ncbi:hypothetical protein HKX48_002142 [Thoreauomyces humboldtii]|nr:hypothetical protein HKX48_002142 [Thoreauomyces humboldtii]
MSEADAICGADIQWLSIRFFSFGPVAHLTPPPRWHLEIHNCENSAAFVPIFYLAGSFCLGTVLYGIATLVYRFLVIKHSLRGIKLASFDAFLLLVNFGSVAPLATYYLVMATGRPKSIYDRKWLLYGWETIPWCMARSAIWAYIVSIAKSTPRSGDIKVYLPKDRHLDLFLRMMVLLEIVSSTPFAIAAGWVYEAENASHKFLVLQAIVNAINCFLSWALSAGAWFFGTQMISIVEESVQNLQGPLKPGGLTSVATQRTVVEVRLSKTVTKMKMARFAILSSLGWNGVVLIAYASIPNEVVILWAEFFPPDEPGDVGSLLHGLHSGGPATLLDPFNREYAKHGPTSAVRVIANAEADDS